MGLASTTPSISGNAGNYGIVHNSDGSITIADHRSGAPDGTDTLTNIERVDFASSILALDISNGAGDAYRLYQAAFDRTPDIGGLTFWVEQDDHGMDLISMAARFIDSTGVPDALRSEPDAGRSSSICSTRTCCTAAPTRAATTTGSGR